MRRFLVVQTDTAGDHTHYSSSRQKKRVITNKLCECLLGSTAPLELAIAMAGYYSMKGKQECWERWFDSVNQAQNDYILDRKYWMPPGSTKCHENSLGSTCTFYGPKNVPKTTQESFLEGRGQVNDDFCPECGVIVLPDSVFPGTAQPRACQDMSLQPQFTRQPKNCRTLAETDISQYAFLPGAWQRGYLGVNSLCDTGINIQSRENARLEYRPSPKTAAQSQLNYGSY